MTHSPRHVATETQEELDAHRHRRPRHRILDEEARTRLRVCPTGTSACGEAARSTTRPTTRSPSLEVRVGIDLALVLASRMMFVADPEHEDVLDAVASWATSAAAT